MLMDVVIFESHGLRVKKGEMSTWFTLPTEYSHVDLKLAARPPVLYQAAICCGVLIDIKRECNACKSHIDKS